MPTRPMMASVGRTAGVEPASGDSSKGSWNPRIPHVYDMLEHVRPIRFLCLLSYMRPRGESAAGFGPKSFGASEIVCMENGRKRMESRQRMEAQRRLRSGWARHARRMAEASDGMPSMADMIAEARARGVRPQDLFGPWDHLTSARGFFMLLTSGKSQVYKDQAEERILLNRPGNAFYDVLLAYLDSEGTGKRDYARIPPASAKVGGLGGFGIVPVDGRHRAQLCMDLGIDLPVRIVG